MAASTPNLIKQVNLQYVRAALLDLKSATKPQMAEHTSLSVITVNALVKYLLDAGEIIEDTVVHPGLGRPAMSYKLNEEFCMALIVYTFEKEGQDTAFFVVRNLYGDSVERLEKPIAAIGPDSFDADILSLLQKHPAIRLIGFGLPATESNGTIISSDYSALVGCPFCREKERLFRLPVFLVNDVKAATVGYCSNNQIDGSRCVVGLYLPHKYAPGIGIYHQGQLIYGCTGLAGRIASLFPHISWGECDYSEQRYQDAVLQIIHIICCLYNPDTVIVYSEASLDFSSLEDYFPAPIDRLLLPELVRQTSLETDFRAGITRLALDELFRLKFPIHGLEV